MFSPRSHPHWLVCIWFRQGWPRPQPGANLTGDMLLGPVVFISREKSKWLGQEFRCVPAAEHGICKTCVSAGWRSSQGWRAAAVCAQSCAWTRAQTLGNPETGLQQLELSRVHGPLGM